MQDPLKQGLKLHIGLVNAIKHIIRMQDPLKQGLKLSADSEIKTQIYSNARSTKTRIETERIQALDSRA